MSLEDMFGEWFLRVRGGGEVFESLVAPATSRLVSSRSRASSSASDAGPFWGESGAVGSSAEPFSQQRGVPWRSSRTSPIPATHSRSSPRFAHVLAGVTWIGLLYFFNFVQVPAYAELSDGARSEALRKLTFRALWWFRYAALLTFLFGVAARRHPGRRREHRPLPPGVGGTAILTGMLFGITMFLNVWGVIWRNQKIVIGNAETVADGGEANPDAPAAAKAAARASRCNTLFSITMLFFMVFAAHGGGFWFDADRAARSSTGCSCSCCGPSSRRRRSASSAASTAPSTSWPSTSTRTRSSVRLRPAGDHLLRRLGAHARRLSAGSAGPSRSAVMPAASWPATSQNSIVAAAPASSTLPRVRVADVQLETPDFPSTSSVWATLPSFVVGHLDAPGRPRRSTRRTTRSSPATSTVDLRERRQRRPHAARRRRRRLQPPVGASDDGTVELEAGSYALYCDVAGHEAAAWSPTLTVS